MVMPRSRSSSIESRSLVAYQPLLDGLGELQDAVGKRRLAVVDVGE
jgi:hypothetical protein